MYWFVLHLAPGSGRCLHVFMIFFKFLFYIELIFADNYFFYGVLLFSAFFNIVVVCCIFFIKNNNLNATFNICF